MKLTTAQQQVVDWMEDGDRALTQCPGNRDAYGYWHQGKWRRICSRKTLEAVIKAGIAEWYKCSPPDLRAMLVLRKPENK